jgi:hypothetical protein
VAVANERKWAHELCDLEAQQAAAAAAQRDAAEAVAAAAVVVAEAEERSERAVAAAEAHHTAVGVLRAQVRTQYPRQEACGAHGSMPAVQTGLLGKLFVVPAGALPVPVSGRRVRPYRTPTPLSHCLRAQEVELRAEVVAAHAAAAATREELHGATVKHALTEQRLAQLTAMFETSKGDNDKTRKAMVQLSTKVSKVRPSGSASAGFG